MKSLKQIIAEGKKMEWGIEAHPDWDQLMFVSPEGSSLVNSAPKKVQSIVELAQSYAEMDFSQRMETDIWTPYEFLGGGAEGSVYRVPIKNGIEVALKVYGDDTRNGLNYFEALVKARQEDEFDTLTPYLATEDYILTSLLPQLPEYEEFVQQHPDLEGEVNTALLNVQTSSRIKDAGLDVPEGLDDDYDFGSTDSEHLDESLEREPTTDAESSPMVKHVYLSRFNPSAKDLKDRYRFFIIDMM
jgi:hypothetical protein